jgi:hypothetical protein
MTIVFSSLHCYLIFNTYFGHLIYIYSFKFLVLVSLELSPDSRPHDISFLSMAHQVPSSMKQVSETVCITGQFFDIQNLEKIFFKNSEN